MNKPRYIVTYGYPIYDEYDSRCGERTYRVPYTFHTAHGALAKAALLGGPDSELSVSVKCDGREIGWEEVVHDAHVRDFHQHGGGDFPW